jgi:hypothetical protein
MPGPALVTDPAANPQPTPAHEAAALEAAQLSLQWGLRLARTAAAEAAMDVRRAADEVRELERQPQHDAAELAALRRRLAGARLLEQKVTEHSRRSEREVDAFRLRAEAAKSRYEKAVAAEEGVARAALAHVTALLAEAPRLLQRISDGASGVAAAVDEPGPRAAAEPADSRPPTLAPGVLELRADPLGGDIRLLFAFEPADAVTILAVLEGEGAIRVHRDAALSLAGDLLADIRTGEWPPPGPAGTGDVELAFADSAAFLDRFFADRPSDIGQRAATRAGADTISALRRRRGVSLADLAAATGISEERLWVIEDDGLRVARVQEIVACLRALGGRLDLTAELEAGPVALY